MIEILTGGASNSVQDLGRRGYLSQGIGASGAMDSLALTTGNLLLGNAPGAAGVEIGVFPFRLRFLADTAFALTGADCRAALDGTMLPPWWAAPAKAGQVLALGPPLWGARAYLCVAGGIDVPLVLGSRSTDLKGGFGGFQGRGLARGDVVAAGAAKDASADFGAVPPKPRSAIRVVPAANYLDFTAESRAAFVAADWRVTQDANRTGYRLAGPVLATSRPLDLFSHGIVPGSIQVPAAGQPIVQLAEANSAGGYPRIATVIEADLWRLGQIPVGGTLRFAWVTRDEAIAALRDLAASIEAVRRGAALVRQA
jgi:biotin-dependent carboxylase-like uncharacterized protein